MFDNCGVGRPDKVFLLMFNGLTIMELPTKTEAVLADRMIKSSKRMLQENSGRLGNYLLVIEASITE